MGEIPHGEHLPTAHTFPGYDCRPMNGPKTPEAGDSSTVPARDGTKPPRRILVFAGGIGIHQSSAQVLIRHETTRLAKNTFISRQENQTGNSASECQLQNLLICPTLHN